MSFQVQIVVGTDQSCENSGGPKYGMSQLKFRLFMFGFKGLSRAFWVKSFGVNTVVGWVT